MRKHVVALAFLSLGSGLMAGCGENPVPARPSWDQDVFPILQGSCNHCHGETVGQAGASPVTRLDVCDPAPFMAANVIPAGTNPGFLGAATSLNALSVPKQIVADAGKSRANMPPPPALPLSAYEREVLLKWAKTAASTMPTAGELHPSCRKQVRNRPPAAKLVSKKVVDDKLVVVLDVTDADGDQVLGKITAGSGASAPSQPITASGRRTAEFAGLSESTEIKVLLVDGYEPPLDLTF